MKTFLIIVMFLTTENHDDSSNRPRGKGGFDLYFVGVNLYTGWSF